MQKTNYDHIYGRSDGKFGYWQKDFVFTATFDLIWCIIVDIIIAPALVLWLLSAVAANLWSGGVDRFSSSLLNTSPIPIVFVIIVCIYIHNFGSDYRKHMVRQDSKDYRYSKVGIAFAITLMNGYDINIPEQRNPDKPRIYLYPTHIHLYVPKPNPQVEFYSTMNTFFYFSGFSSLAYRIYLKNKSKQYKEDLI